MHKLHKIHSVAANYRGRIIHAFTYIEVGIDAIIALYFASNDKTKKQELLYHLIGDKATFEIKRPLFNYIVETYHKDVLDKHPTLVKDINDMQVIRNILGHRKLFITNLKMKFFDGDNVTFENFGAERDNKNNKKKKGKIVGTMKPETFNKKIVDEIETKMFDIVSVLLDITNKYPQPDESGK